MSTPLDSEENYLYGMMFSLVRDQLKALDKARFKKSGVWAKARGASRELKIEETLRDILKRKSDRIPDEQVIQSLQVDLIFIAEDNEVWDDVDMEQANYVAEIAARTYL